MSLEFFYSLWSHIKKSLEFFMSSEFLDSLRSHTKKSLEFLMSSKFLDSLRSHTKKSLEFLMSSKFLDSLWSHIKKCLEFLMSSEFLDSLWSHIKMSVEYFDSPTKVICLVIASAVALFWCRSGPTMKAPGGGGRRINRGSFERDPKGYFKGLHKKDESSTFYDTTKKAVGVAGAVAAFAGLAYLSMASSSEEKMMKAPGGNGKIIPR